MSPMERAESAMRANFELLVRLWRVSPATAALRWMRFAMNRTSWASTTGASTTATLRPRRVAPPIRAPGCALRRCAVRGMAPRPKAGDWAHARCAAQGATLAETNANLDKIVALAAELQGAATCQLSAAPARGLTRALQLRTARSRCGALRRCSRTRGSCRAPPRRLRLPCLPALPRR